MNNNTKTNGFFSWICTALIWLVFMYSSIIQQYIKISNAMLILGVGIMLFYFLSYTNEPFSIQSEVTIECRRFIPFMIYMLLVGIVFSPALSRHMSQWITSIEYMLIMIVIASKINRTGTESFQLMLLMESIVLAIVFFLNPVKHNNGRYALSMEMNPNGLGMSFCTGIWATLYYQSKKKVPLSLSFFLVGVFTYCIILSGSRKSIIAAGIIFILWFLFVFFPSTKEKRWGWGFVYLLFAAVIIIYIGNYLLDSYSNSTLYARMENLQYESTEGSRNMMYRIGWNMFKARPLFGYGFQGYSYYNGAYSHSTLVEIPVSGGIIGSILYFYTYFISIRKVIYLFRWSSNREDLREEKIQIKMLLILWMAYLFFCTCIIHIYQFGSFIVFGLIFGQTNYLERKVTGTSESSDVKVSGCKYIK